MAPVIIGIAIFTRLGESINDNIDKTFKFDTKPMENRCCHFFLYMAWAILGSLVGFVIVSALATRIAILSSLVGLAFTMTIANPFTLAACVAGGISACIMFGLGMMTMPAPSPESFDHNTRHDPEFLSNSLRN
jgi:hypothetical protein